MSTATNILNYISPNTSFVVNLDDYSRFIEIAKLEEQERIVKLLETHLRYVDWEGIFWEPETTGKSHAVDVPDIVALIKGEQK